MELRFKGLISVLGLLYSANLYATAELINVEQASAWDKTTSTTTTTIFGGLGGERSDCVIDTIGTSFCNNCLSGELKVCNTRRIYDDLQLKITFKDSEQTGEPLLKVGDTKVTLIDEGTANQSVAAGQTHTVYVEWGELCGALNKSGTTCEGLTPSGTLKFGIKSNTSTDEFVGTASDVTVKVIAPDSSANTVEACTAATAPTRGLCYFNAFPGDEKVYIEEPEAASAGSFPTSPDSTTFRFFRIIYSDKTFNKSVLNPYDAIREGRVANLPIESGDSNTAVALTNKTVEGLTNNVVYYFRGMLVDDAQNITDITDDTVYTTTFQTECSGDGNPNSPVVDPFTCPVAATPDEVIGLLTEDLNCFISTAAYGTSFAPKVKSFRQFRKKFLLPYRWGRSFNLLYYKYGAKASLWIVKDESRRALAREFLYPLWLFAEASLQWGFSVALLLLLASMASFILLLFYFCKLIDFGIKKIPSYFRTQNQ